MNDITDVVKQATPPIAVSTLSLFGVQLSEWVYLLTIIYLMCQIVLLIRKIIRR